MTELREARADVSRGAATSGMRLGYFGVEGIDELLPSGLAYDTQIMVQGDTGVGKSVLAAQFLYEGLLVGDYCIYIAIDEPPEVMRETMANFRLGTMAYERLERLVFVDAFGRQLSNERLVIREPGNFDEFFTYLRQIVDEYRRGPTRLVTDSISTIMATASLADILEFNDARLRFLRSREVLTLDNYVAGVLEERTLAGLSHSYPLILTLTYARVDGGLQRFLQFGKLKSGQFRATRHSFTIDPRTGIVVTNRR